MSDATNSLVYYGGSLADSDYNNANPVVIRGYDLAGNLIASIRYGDDVPPYTAENYQGYQMRYYVNGFTAEGVATTGTAINTVPRCFPSALAADVDGFIYAASDAVWGTTVYYDYFRKYRRNGDRVPFPQLHGAPIHAIALDAAGNIYVTGHPAGASAFIFRKYDAAGNLLWSKDGEVSGQIGWAIALDEAGDVYVLSGGWNGTYAASHSARIAKYNASGALQWRRFYYGDIRADTLCVKSGVVTSAVNNNEGFYFTGLPETITEYVLTHDTASIKAMERDSNGNALIKSLALWDAATGGFLSALTVTNSANGFQAAYGFQQTADGRLHICAYDTLQTPYYHSYVVLNADLSFVSKTALVTDSVLDIYGVSLRVHSSGQRFFLTPSRYYSWVAENRNNYTPVYGSFHAHVLSAAGGWIWRDKNATGKTGVWYDGVWYDGVSAWPATGTYGYGSGLIGTAADVAAYLNYIPDAQLVTITGELANAWSLACIALVENTTMPALAIPLAFGVATTLGDRYVHIPSLALRVALKPPSFLRDFVGAYLPQVIYRLFLEGTGGPFQLPLSSFQARRNDSLTRLSVVCPLATQSQIDAISDRADNGVLVLYRGLRFSDGTEQLDEMMRCDLKSVRSDIGSSRVPFSLDGESTVEVSSKTRMMKGISYRAYQNGRRRVRCDVDTYLLPGDTADLGGDETLLVAEIVYQVDSDSALMEIAE